MSSDSQDGSRSADEIQSDLKANLPAPPSGSLPTPKKRFHFTRKNVTLGIIIVIILAIVGAVIGGKSSSTTSTSQTPSQSQAGMVNNQESAPAPQTTVGEALVARVIDGDTIEVQFSDGRKATVRYIGIDCPESGKPYSNEAKALNESLVSSKTVRLEKDISETDTYGRLLRYVFAGDIFVNDMMVVNGLATAVSYPPDTKYYQHFCELQSQATSSQLGLWTPVPPVVTPNTTQSGTQGSITVYTTNTGSKYHRDGCRYLSKSKIPISLSQAKAQGLGP